MGLFLSGSCESCIFINLRKNSCSFENKLKKMIAENSGKIYRFKMDFDLGFGFAEIYDFTDHSMFDGRYAYVYARIDPKEQAGYSMQEIRSSSIALGPITLYKFPNIKGVHSWKYLFQTTDFLLNDIPVTKNYRGLLFKDNNWDNLTEWYKSGDSQNRVRYEEIRNLETRILSSSVGVVMQFSMKALIDSGKSVSEYYNLSELGNKNLFVYLVNTYYPLEQAKTLLKEISPR
jgi:hypothetical protein